MQNEYKTETARKLSMAYLCVSVTGRNTYNYRRQNKAWLSNYIKYKIKYDIIT